MPGDGAERPHALLRALLVVAVILLGAAFFLPSGVRVTRVVAIARPAASVAALISTPGRFRDWSPWTDGGVERASESPPVFAADGRLTSTLSVPGLGPVASEWRLSEGRGITLVEWSLEVTVGADPWSRYRGILTAERLGDRAAAGLARLQRAAEREPSAR